jgi:hypothetical protein
MRKAFLALLVFVVSSFGAVAMAAPRVDAAPQAQVAAATATTPRAHTSATERQVYAAREKKASPELAKFQGGDVVIGLSTVAAVFIGVILILVLI